MTWTLLSDFQVLDQSFLQRRDMCYSKQMADKFSVFRIQQLHNDDNSPDAKIFRVILTGVSQKVSENFIEFFEKVAKQYEYTGPMPLFEEPNCIILNSDSLTQIYQCMLIAAGFDSSLRTLVFGKIKEEFLPVYDEPVQKKLSFTELRQNLHENNNIKIVPNDVQESSIDAYTATAVANGLEILREREAFRLKHGIDEETMIESLSNVVDRSVFSKDHQQPTRRF